MCNLCRTIRNSRIEVGCVWLWVGDIGYGDDGKNIAKFTMSIRV